MTTTSTHTAAATTPDPSDQDETQRRSWTLYVPFIITVIVASVAALIALQATGYVGSYQYDSAMWIILTLFNLAVMAVWPVVFLVRARKRQFFLMHLLVRGVVILGSIIFTVFFLQGFINSFGETADALWSVPGWGPFGFTIGAIILHAATAFVLVIYPKENPKLKEDQDSLRELEGDIHVAERAHRRAVNEHTARERLVQVEQPDDVTIVTKPDGTPTYDALKKTKDDAAKAVTEADERYKESDEFKALAAIDAEKTENGTDRANKLAEINQQKALINATSDKTRKTSLETRKKELAAELDALVVLQADIDERQRIAKAALEASDAKRELTDAEEASKNASEVEAVVRKRVETLVEHRNEAAIEMAAKGAALNEATTKLAEAQQRIKESNQTAWTNIRDFLLVPVLSILMLFIAFNLYLSWYGWVRLTIG